MKRSLSLLLCFAMLLSLWGCEAAPAGDTDPTTPVIIDQEKVVYPQTGDYQETALLANVPGQGWPQLLSVRKDGTVDYIFSASEMLDARGSLTKDGLQYYTITPSGSYSLQDAPWIGELEQYLTRAWSDTGVEAACWQYEFSAEDGIILILAQLEDPKAAAGERILCSALFKVENGAMTLIPIDWNVETDSGLLSIDKTLIGGLYVEEDAIVMEYIGIFGIDYKDSYLSAVYAMNGELVELRETALYPIVQPDGSIMYSTDPEGTPAYSLPSTDDESLYLLGSPWAWRRATARTADDVFYTWIQVPGQGVLMQYSPNPAGRIEPEVLTVWSLEDIETIRAAVVQWNHTHASPIFRYETCGDSEDLTRLNLELANGQGPDVLILDGLNTDAYLDFMAPLEGIDTEGVYENLLEPFTVGGELLALPTRMNPWLLGRTVSGTSRIGSLSEFADLVTTSTGVLDLSADFGNAYRYYDALYNVTFAEDVFDQWYPAWADAIFENGQFRAEPFREFLIQTKRLVEHYSLGTLADEGMEERDFINATDDSRYGNSAMRPFPYTLAATNYVGLNSYWWQSREDIPVDEIPCLIDGIPGPDGTGVTVPKNIAAVRAGGSEAEGLEFLQLLLSDAMQLGGQYYDNGTADGYPVKWEPTQTLIDLREGYMNQEFAVENDFRATLEGLRAVVIDEFPYRIALEAALGYYTGSLTLDEAVAQVREGTALYLAEQIR